MYSTEKVAKDAAPTPAPAPAPYAFEPDKKYTSGKVVVDATAQCKCPLRLDNTAAMPKQDHRGAAQVGNENTPQKGDQVQDKPAGSVPLKGKGWVGDVSSVRDG